MKKFVAIEYWDYMDAKPITEVRVFESIDEETLKKDVNDFVAHMKSHWCSGTTKLIGIMEQSEAFKWIEQQIRKEHNNWLDGSQEFIDKLCRFYKECYGGDIEELLHQLDIANDYADREC